MSKALSRDFKMLSWTILYDPSGDFKKGAKLGHSDLKELVKSGHLPPDMILECGGTQYKVTQYHQVVEI